MVDKLGQDLLLETRLIIDLKQGAGGYQPSPHGTTGGVRWDYRGIVWEAQVQEDEEQAALRRGRRKAIIQKHVGQWRFRKLQIACGLAKGASCSSQRQGTQSEQW